MSDYNIPKTAAHRLMKQAMSLPSYTYYYYEYNAWKNNKQRPYNIHTDKLDDFNNLLTI